MRSVMLKMLSVLSAVTVVISAFFVSGDVFAREVADKGDFKYVISADGKTAEIVSYVGQSLYVSIPAEIEKCRVTSIGAAAFKNNSTIKELDITDSITEVDTAAFSGCTALKKVHISGSVGKIGRSAFSGCTALKELSLDDGIEKIERYAFSECTSLTSVVLPNSVDYVGDYAFINCTDLSKPQMPKTMRYFGGYVFENTKWMQSQKSDFVTVGDGILVKYIGKSDIKSIPKSIKIIGSYAFAGNNNIKRVMLPSSVSVIQNSSFEGCQNLEDIYLPESIERIGERAFFNCKTLKKIELTDRMTLIDSYSFAGAGLTEIAIPKNVSVINEGAFDGCKQLKDVKVGSGLKKISSFAFRDCISLKHIVFPANVQEIEKDAFLGCEKLLRAEFNGDTKLNDSAFDECPNMKAAVFYHNPKMIEDNAFNQIPELVIYSDNNMYLDEYAKKNNKLSENIKNLPQYNEYIPNDGGKKDDKGFSLGYTLITILIIIIDIGVIGLFAFYILIADRKRGVTSVNTERRRRDASRGRYSDDSEEENNRQRTSRKHPARVSSSDKVTYVSAPDRSRTKKPHRPAHAAEGVHSAKRTKNQSQPLDAPIPQRRPSQKNRPASRRPSENRRIRTVSDDTREFDKPGKK